MNKIWLILMIMAATIIVAGAAPVGAGGPTDCVKSILDRVLAIQNDPALAGPAKEPARAKAIRQIIDKSFDYNLMARNSLGASYGRLSDGQRQEFTKVFSYLFQDSYTRLVLNFLKQETIQYKQERPANDGTWVITSLVRPNETIPVDYLVQRHQQGWLLTDVMVDGVSILDNYKRQFTQIIQTKSFDHLMEKMKTQYRAMQ